MALVEGVLDGAATRVAPVLPSQAAKPVAEHALWICACVTPEDAPTWLIYDDEDGQVRWGRIPDGAEAVDVVDARLTAGGHAAPGDVLAWLRGEAADPWWCGDGWGDAAVVPTLAGRIRGS